MNAQLIKKAADLYYGGDTKKARAFLGTCSTAFQTLEAVVVDRLESLDRAAANYDDAAWAFKQAHFNGKREALLEVLNILNVTDDRKSS